MASKDSNELEVDAEKGQTACSNRKQGGWITFPFILGNMMGLSVAIFGVTSNLIVYLIEQFNVKGIDAAQISNIINGCINLAPIAGAAISDSFLGCFAVVGSSSLLSLLGMVLFTLMATIRSLRPPPCPPSSTCEAPSAGQNAVLYLAVAMASIGTGGTRFNTGTMGANQFDRARDQNVFFNWYFFVMYVAAIIGSTAVVYVQDNVSWGWGFGVCAMANAAGVIALFMGSRYYRGGVPEGSPYVGMSRVVVAAARKWRVKDSPETTEYYCCSSSSGEGKPKRQVPTGSFRFLNRAALKTPGDTNADGSLAKPWRLCAVDEVEDLKAVLRILPLWFTSIFISVSIGIVQSLTVLQALTIDRHLGPHFAVPAGSLSVSTLATSAVALPLLDRCVYPAWRKRLGRAPTPLQRLGVGHAVNAAAVAAAALVERRRIGIVQSRGLVHEAGAVVPMSVLWLLLPLMVLGLGEAFHLPAQVALYYQEFPENLRSTATGMVGLVVAVGFYVSTAVVDLVRRATDWLPENINASRVDKVYWMLGAVAAANFGCYMVCAILYRYQAAVDGEEGAPSSAVDAPEVAAEGGN